MKARSIILVVAAILGLLPTITRAAVETTTSPDQMSDFALWGVVGGLAATLAAAVINQAHWRAYTKFAVFFVVGLVIAAGDAYFTRALDLHNWTRAALVVIVSGSAWYTAHKTAITAIQTKTSA